jgi:hypothetical protein
MKQRDLQQFEAAVTVGFSHAQIDPEVQTLDNAAVVQLPGLEIVHQQVFMVGCMTKIFR